MNLANAALVALIGMLLLTIVTALEFFNVVLGVMHDIVPMLALLKAAIYFFASLSLTVFFFVFRRGQA